MGVYSRVIFPRLCHRFMARPWLVAYRKDLLADVRGEVLEIGAGSGLNLACYPAGVKRVVVADPNPSMHALVRRRGARADIAVDQCVFRGEQLPLVDGAFDCVVSTWTLCSIRDVRRALGEVVRVLKPGGRFVFLEHGLSKNPRVQRWQRRLNPLHGLVSDGCRLDLDVSALLAELPFRSVHMEQFDLERTPRWLGHTYRGAAIK